MIAAALLKKIGLVGAIFIAGGFGGMILQKKLQPEIKFSCPEVRVPKCPDCNCPPTLGSEFDKIKAKGRSNITLHLHQNYTTCNDSTDFKQIISESVSNALENYTVKKKR